MTEGYKKMFWGAMFVSFAGVIGLVALLMTLAGWVIIVAGLGNNDKNHFLVIFQSSGFLQ